MNVLVLNSLVHVGVYFLADFGLFNFLNSQDSFEMLWGFLLPIKIVPMHAIHHAFKDCCKENI